MRSREVLIIICRSLSCSMAPCQRYIDCMIGSRLTQAASRASTSAAANAAASVSAGSVVRTMT